MSVTTLSPETYLAALQARLQANTHLPDRTSYIGASEVGTCLRRVVAAKLDPMSIDSASMGRMLAGRAMENEVIQLVRHALLGKLRDTGRSQRELIHPALPFRAHPDGRLLGNGEGDGVLEVKTASAATFKRYRDQGIPETYLDQVQAQMGLSGSAWALVVLVSREDLSQVATFPVRFNADRYAQLEARARRANFHLEEATLPDGEPECGFCHSCPLASTCPTLRKASPEGEVPEVLRLELECQVDELGGLEERIEHLQSRVTELREQIKSALDLSGAARVCLDNGTVQVVSNSRTSLDSKALQREAPEVYSRFLRTTSYSTLRINRKGGAPWSMAS